MDERHSPAHLDHFRRHGWVLVQGLLGRDEVEAALPGLYELYPRPEDFHAGSGGERGAPFGKGAGEAANAGADARFRPLQFAGLKEFPHPDLALNLLALHPAILALAEEILKTADIRLYQAETFAKYTGVTAYDQPFHIDYTNHTMLPPRADGRWAQAQMFLYLSDVTAAHGPTRIVSRELTADVPLTRLAFPSARVASERLAEWEAAATDATGPAGSLLVYRADTVHRGTEMTLPGGGRFFFNLAYKAAGADWVGANPWPRKGFLNWRPLVEACAPRQLEALGFPPPGHPYWDATTLAGAADRYPGLDLGPWRERDTSGSAAVAGDPKAHREKPASPG